VLSGASGRAREMSGSGNRSITCRIVLWLPWVMGIAGSATAGAQDGFVPLAITTASAQTAVVGQALNLTLTPKGGSPPYNWQVISGKLPDGLELDSASGVMAGRLRAPAVHHFTVRVQDSSVPPLQAQREIVLTVAGPNRALTLDWQQPPVVHHDEIRGSLEVANHSDEPFDLTVVVLAVNEIGRATALGYQHFTLAPEASQIIPFGAGPGEGAYMVHADAIAEVESTNSIYRARKQTTTPLRLKFE